VEVQPRLSGGWPLTRVEPKARVVKEQIDRRQKALAKVPLFSGLPKKHARELARVSLVREYPEGAFIVREGEHGTTFYVLLEGKARVVRGGRKLSGVGPEDFFGELALLDGGPRAASVVTETAVRCLELSGKDFAAVLKKDATLAIRILQGMAQWLRGDSAPGGPVDGVAHGR
jgi:CRP-like cAMP-binding protein